MPRVRKGRIAVTTVTASEAKAALATATVPEAKAIPSAPKGFFSTIDPWLQRIAWITAPISLLILLVTFVVSNITLAWISPLTLIYFTAFPLVRYYRYRKYESVRARYRHSRLTRISPLIDFIVLYASSMHAMDTNPLYALGAFLLALLSYSVWFWILIDIDHHSARQFICEQHHRAAQTYALQQIATVLRDTLLNLDTNKSAGELQDLQRSLNIVISTLDHSENNVIAITGVGNPFSQKPNP